MGSSNDYFRPAKHIIGWQPPYVVSNSAAWIPAGITVIGISSLLACYIIEAVGTGNAAVPMSSAMLQPAQHFIMRAAGIPTSLLLVWFWLLLLAYLRGMAQSMVSLKEPTRCSCDAVCRESLVVAAGVTGSLCLGAVCVMIESEVNVAVEWVAGVAWALLFVGYFGVGIIALKGRSGPGAMFVSGCSMAAKLVLLAACSILLILRIVFGVSQSALSVAPIVEWLGMLLIMLFPATFIQDFRRHVLLQTQVVEKRPIEYTLLN